MPYYRISLRILCSILDNDQKVKVTNLDLPLSESTVFIGKVEKLKRNRYISDKTVELIDVEEDHLHIMINDVKKRIVT